MAVATDDPSNSLWRALARQDVRLYDVVCARRSERLNRFMILLTRSGDTRVYLLCAVIAWLVGRGAGAPAMAMAVAAGLAAAAGYIPKRLIARPRPTQRARARDALLAHPDAWSFPSSHTACAFAVACTVGQYFGPVALFAALIWASLMAISRVYVGAHYPLDVAMGALLGIGVAGWLGGVRDVIGQALLGVM